MEESALLSKAEKYLENIQKEILDLDNLDKLDNFKSVYFTLCDRLDHLQEMKSVMDLQGYTSPFRSLNKYGSSAVEELTVEERGDVSRHNQYFRTKAIAKKNILDRVSSAIDSHKVAIGTLEEYSNLKCDSCYKSFRINDFKANNCKCTCGSTSFSFKVNKDKTYRLEILPYLPFSGDYMVAITDLSPWGRNAFKQVLKLLKQERRGVVKTISLVIKYKDKNNHLIRKQINLDSEFVDNYEEEVRKTYGKNVRIEVLRFHRTKPAIINDKHARNALALAYTKYSEKITSEIADSILKKKISNFKKLKSYEAIKNEVYTSKPSFIENENDLRDWRAFTFTEKLKSNGFMNRYDDLNRGLSRDLKIKDNIEKNIFTNIPETLILWDIFKYYLTSSYNQRKKLSSPFPYIRVEIDRKQRSVFAETHKKVIEVLKEETKEKILEIDNMDLILYEKFKIEKQIKNSNIKIYYPGMGAGLISLNSDLTIDDISKIFNINTSKIKKEIKNIKSIKKPKTVKSKKFLEMIKK